MDLLILMNKIYKSPSCVVCVRHRVSSQRFHIRYKESEYNYTKEITADNIVQKTYLYSCSILLLCTLIYLYTILYKYIYLNKEEC